MEYAEAYIPTDRRFALRNNVDVLEHAIGSVLFADISGFTPMTESLVRQLGPRRGAEELTKLLNRVYDALIAEVDAYRGSVIGFSGDAITCWFDGDYGLWATASALRMQQAMKHFIDFQIPTGETMSLAMKAAVATGPVRRFLVGNPDIQYIDVLAGATLDYMAMGEKHANKGEVVLDSVTMEHIGDRVNVDEWRIAEGTERQLAIVSGMRDMVDTFPWPDSCTCSLSNDAVRPWLLPPVYARLTSGQGDFLAEIRPVVPMFLRFSGIDYDNDPDAGTKLDAYIQWIQTILKRYEGFLIQLTVGDKGSYLYAAFGAPIAHDDDPLRAVAAALEMRSPPPTFDYIDKVQIGITRGQARTGAYGGTTRRTYGVLGDEVNLAARLMAYAQPGQVVVSQRIVDATQNYYEFDAQGAIRVKGKSYPIDIALALGRKQFQRQRTFSVSLNPLVGREHELAQIEHVLDTALNGTGQIVRIEGGAGIGKSHLANECRRRAAKRNVQVFLGGCQSISQGIAYLPWRQIFRAFFALDDEPTGHEGHLNNDYINTQIAQIETMLTWMNPDWLLRLPLLGDLLDLPIPDNATTASFDARLRQEALFALMVDIVQAWAADTPLLLVLEDVHWMDEPSLGLSIALSRIVDRLPVVLLLVHRPSLEQGGIGVVQDCVSFLQTELQLLAHHSCINLNELSLEAMGSLVANRLGGPVASLALELVHAQTQGNPFFVEELIDTLRESGKLCQKEGDATWVLDDTLIDSLEAANCLMRDSDGQWMLLPQAKVPTEALGIPDSVYGVVLSRIDRLPESHKLTIKIASVIGRVFSINVLAKAHPQQVEPDVLHAELQTMEQRDFTHLETPQPYPTYMFKHNVTMEVAYGTMLETQRKELHCTVGRALEELHPDEVEQLAYHFSQAGEREKTLVYTQKAARKAQRDYANETALRYYQQALELEECWEWRKEMVNIYHFLGQRQAEQATLHQLEVSPQVPTFDVAYLWGRYYEAISDYPKALVTTEQALTISREQGHRMNEIYCLSQLGVIARRQGDYALGQTKYTEALERIQVDMTPTGKLTPESAQTFALVLDGLGTIHRNLGYFDAAQTCYKRALELNRSSGNRKGEADVLNNLGNMADAERNFTEALKYYHQSLDMRRMIGDRVGEGASVSNIAAQMVTIGDYIKARDNVLMALSIVQSTGNRWNEINIWNELGIIYQELGDFAQAHESLVHAFELSKSIGDEAGQAYVLVNLGSVVRDQGDMEQATALLHEGLILAQQQDDAFLVSAFQSYLGTVCVLVGHYDQAIEHANMALQIRRELDMEVMTTMELATLATAYLQQGISDMACDYARQARTILDECGGEGPEAPQRDYFLCYDVLNATGCVEEAHRSLLSAHRLVMERAEKITDAALRASFLEQVPINRQIVKAVENTVAVQGEERQTKIIALG